MDGRQTGELEEGEDHPRPEDGAAKRSRPEPGERRRRSRRAALPLALFLIASGAHAVTLAGGIVFDDRPGVRDNPVVRGDVPLSRLPARDFWGRPPGPTGVGTWRPLPVLGLVVDQRLGGGAPWLFHLSNVLGHGFAVLALFYALLAHRAPLRAAAATAALFAVMTVNTEAVAEIVGRADVLATAFGLLAWGLLRPVDAGATGGRLALAGAAMLAALLCKESAIAFPVFVLVADQVVGSPRPRLLSWRNLALLAPVLVAVVLRTACYALPGVELARSWNNNPLLGEPFGVRLLTGLRLTLLALRTSLLPLNLSPDYAWAEIEPDRSPFAVDVLGGALAAVVLAAAIVALRRRRPLLVTGLLLFAVQWASLSNVAVVLPTIFAERLLYGPAAGLALALVALGELAAERGRPRLVAGVFLALVAGQTALTVKRGREWRDDLTLFGAALETSPRSVRVLTNYGAALIDRGRGGEALAPLERALELAPDSPGAHTHYGIALDLAGRPQVAFTHLTAGARLDPWLAQAHYNLAIFLARHGKPAEAISVLRAFLARQPESPRERDLLTRLSAGR